VKKSGVRHTLVIRPVVPDVTIDSRRPPRARQMPLTTEARLFGLRTRVIRHEHWSGWRRRRQVSARESHYARRTEIAGCDA
jgi:hypothetical protein